MNDATTNQWQVLRVGAILFSIVLVIFATSQVRADSAINVVKVDEQAWYEAEDKAVAREIISPRNSSVVSMSIAQIKVPAGVEVVPHHHMMEEVYHVVSGTGLMMVEDDYQQLVAGDTVVIAPHQWHNIKNNGDAMLLLVVTCVPAWAPELLQFVREASAVDADSDPTIRSESSQPSVSAAL